MTDREKVIKGLEKCWDAFNHMEHELYADYIFDALELLKSKQDFRYKESRYKPGRWNGLNGGEYYGQYFDMDNADRMREMIEVASALTEYGVPYVLTKLKRQYRITVSRGDYWHMDTELQERIYRINVHHDAKDGETG